MSTFRLRRTCATLGVSALMTACASTAPVAAPSIEAALASTTPPAAAPAAGTTPQAAAANGAGAGAHAAPAAATPPTALKPFADVIKDAKRTDGLFPVWQKDEKVWIEIAPEQFGQPYFFAFSRTRGLGESRLYGNWMLDEYIVEFQRVGNVAQLIAKNTRFTTQEKTPLAQALRNSFTDSLLASSTVVSLPHPERKTVLIDANALLLADIPSLTPELEEQFRLAYTLDARNSSFAAVRATPTMTSFEVNALYAVPRLPAPPAGPVPPGVKQPKPPANLMDGRNMFIGYHYSLATLPAPVMAPRLADDRVGHFVTKRWDFTDETDTKPLRYFVNRWRLEKKDPAAALSEPVKPIVFWLDRNIPERYRETVKQGVLEWNKAFERIGFKDAVKVEIQPDNADFDLADAQHASIRWFLDSDDGALAVGPSQVDPRTGEILDADIDLSDNWARLPRRLAAEQFPARAAAHDAHDACNYAEDAMEEVGFALDLLEARGEIEPGSPEAEAIVKSILKDVVTHEVGHTLGLRHNFRASTTIPLAKVQDPAYTHEHGLSGSVMDYNAFNVALESEHQGEYAMSTLGAYDYWAIEYAYTPFAPDQERAGLARIAARSTDPALAYGTDEEAAGSQGYDPEVNQRDLGDDPLAFAVRRIALSNELWRRLQDKSLKPGESYAVRRRNVESGLRQFGLAADLAAKYVGGVVYVRDHAGSPRASFTPVPAARQRQALKLLTDQVFAADALNFKPEFVARLVEDGLDRGYSQPKPPALAQSVFAVHKAVLDRVLSDGVATRLVESATQVADPKTTLSVAELNAALTGAIWSELRSGADINLVRRNLQREHVRRLAVVLLKPSAGTPPDARAVARSTALALTREIERAKNGRRLSGEARAHLDESLATLQEALRAPLQRAGA